LDDVVHVVALHREVHQAEPEALASARERMLEGAEAAMRPQGPDFPADPDGDVERTATKLPARPVRNILARGLSLAAGAPPGAAPARQGELLLDRVHSCSVREGSDTAATATMTRRDRNDGARLRRRVGCPLNHLAASTIPGYLPGCGLRRTASA